MWKARLCLASATVLALLIGVLVLALSHSCRPSSLEKTIDETNIGLYIQKGLEPDVPSEIESELFVFDDFTVTGIRSFGSSRIIGLTTEKSNDVTASAIRMGMERNGWSLVGVEGGILSFERDVESSRSGSDSKIGSMPTSGSEGKVSRFDPRSVFVTLGKESELTCVVIQAW